MGDKINFDFIFYLILDLFLVDRTDEIIEIIFPVMCENFARNFLLVVASCTLDNACLLPQGFAG